MSIDQREEYYGTYHLDFDRNIEKESQYIQESQEKNTSEQESDRNYQQFGERKQKKNLRIDEVEQLNEKRQNLEQFMSRIGDIANQPIRQDILEHCEKISGNIPQNLNKFQILRLVKNRVDKMIKNKRIKKNWSQEDINILIWVISKYCQYHGVSSVKDGITQADWASISSLIPGVTGKNCMFKWLSLKKSNLADNSWAEDQSLLLHEMVEKYKQNWCRISEQLYIRNPLANKVYRCPKQCREHWNCYLNPMLKKGPWEKKQDYLLLRSVRELNGIKKWAQIVKLFNGRTQNALKNRFTLIIEKEQKDQRMKKKLNQFELVQAYIKKHQNQFHIDQAKLRFLWEKRQQISENLAKKKPKKIKSRKNKDNRESNSEQDQYIPMESPYNQINSVQRHSIRTRYISKQSENHFYQESQEYPKYDNIQQNHYEPDESIRDLIQIKREEQIYESDEEECQGQGQKKPYQPFDSFNLRGGFKNFQSAFENPRSSQWMIYQAQQLPENIQLPRTNITILSLTVENYFENLNHQFIPCTMKENDDKCQIRKLRLD